MRKIFPVCCASADYSKAQKMHSDRRDATDPFQIWILIFIENVLYRLFLMLSPQSKIQTVDVEPSESHSLDHPIRSRQHVRRNRQADLLGGLQIDHQLELGRLLDRQVGRLGAFQDFVHVGGGAPVTCPRSLAP